MPRDGTITRERIVERATSLFNERGYSGTSMRDLLDATGLEKGGLYHHFGSKETLALEAFDHAVDVIRRLIREALADERHAVLRVHRVLDVYVGIVERPPFPGGCPLLNTAVEADDTHPPLRRRVRAAMDELLHGTVERILVRGVERGEVRPDVDVEGTAALLVAAVEGGVMLSNLYRDPEPMRRVVAMLRNQVDALAAEEDGS